MKLWQRKLSRRTFLALSGGAVAATYLGRGFAQAQMPAAQTLRLGLILPDPTVTTAIEAASQKFVHQNAQNAWTMAGEELGANAEMFGQTLELKTVTAASPEEAAAAAEALIDEDEVFVFAGAFDDATGLALSAVARDKQVPFFNLGATTDALRNASCDPYTFHLQASAAMYLDSLTDWYVRAEFRDWFYVYSADEAGQALYDRVVKARDTRHFAAKEVGSLTLDPASSDYADVVSQIQDSGAQVVLLLVDAQKQLELMTALDAAQAQVQVTGFPYPATQTRAYFAASREAAPIVGTGNRAELWEAKIDAYGARELNERYLERFEVPMDGPAWAAYQAVKIGYEAAAFGGGTEADKVITYLESPNTNFDVYKGIGVSFRPWDHQLRQSLFLVDINDAAQTPFDYAIMVGELPEIYMPGTDPIERLDQIGDLEADSQCQL